MVTVFGKRIRLFRPRTIWIRRVVQWFFFLLITFIAVNHTLVQNGAGIPFLSSASLHAVCPFGGVETLYTFAVSGLLVKKIHDFFARSRGHRSGALLFVWSGLLRMGLPVGYSAGMGWQDRQKNIQTKIQPLCPCADR